MESRNDTPDIENETRHLGKLENARGVVEPDVFEVRTRQGETIIAEVYSLTKLIKYYGNK